MGEVYRAEDLKLGQPVALKFLPVDFETSPDRLQRFLDEVRTARQISHANVCRIYDIGESDGHHFISMEYVDGEDLASLLRRIGRLPREKAIQIARQLCAGLAASHEIGVLHRDLKPGNIMIDGRGRARITDFGLAGFAGQIAGLEVYSGTPAYMSPEQLAGREVSVRSDLYALGLVLYELFTGRQVFAAASLAERRRLETGTTPSSPSSFVEGFDPAVERVILRCLDPDPALRPSSALSVAAALPGGDPLAAALAAGETPSPEMVAEALDSAAAPASVSWGALVLFLAALAASIALGPATLLTSATRIDKPPAFLAERAREILALAGYAVSPADTLYGFTPNGDYLHAVQQQVDAGASGRQLLQATPPSGILFTYRQSPAMLAPVHGAALGNWSEDPPDIRPGMMRVELDPDGRLVSLRVVPGERLEPSDPGSAPDWEPLLRATGVDSRTLVPAAPELAPPVFADRLTAWTGTWPARPDIPLRIEGAAAGSRVVWFKVAGPWTHPAEAPASASAGMRSVAALVEAFVYVLVVVATGVVALRNVRHGRGDRRGALRLALYLGAIRMLWFVGAHHVASSDELEIFVGHLSYAMQRVGLAYVFYLAVEPYARRLWPTMLTSWVRVLSGRFRDPLVGRDLLIGCATGAVMALVVRLSLVVPETLGGVSSVPRASLWGLMSLDGPLSTFTTAIGFHTTELLSIIFPVTMLLVFRMVLRRTLPAITVVSLLASVMFLPETGSVPGYFLAGVIQSAIIWTVLFRFGLLCFAAAFTMSTWVDILPLSFHAGSATGQSALVAAAIILAPALWGFWISRAGRPLFADEILEPATRV